MRHNTRTLIFALTLTLVFSKVHALVNQCQQSFQLPAQEREFGVEAISKSNGRTVVIAVAMPAPGGRLLDLNAMGHATSLPDSFIYSDGAFDTPFIEVDNRPGTPLNAALDSLIAELRQSSSSQQEAQLNFLRTFVSRKMGEAPDADQSNAKHVPEVEDVINRTVGHFPVPTHLKKAVVQLESFLDARQGNCVPKTLITSLILRRLGINHAIRAGATEFSGHLWIELDDGRILDPTWQLLERPHFNGSWPGWFGFSRSFLHIDPVYPITVDF